MRRARERLAVSDEALAELTRIHESPFRRLLGRISEQARTRWERALLTALVAVFQWNKLYIKKDHDTRRLRAGLPWLIATGCASLAIGLYGAMYESYRSVMVAIAAFIVWSVLVDKVKRIEQAEMMWLLE